MADERFTCLNYVTFREPSFEKKTREAQDGYGNGGTQGQRYSSVGW